MAEIFDNLYCVGPGSIGPGTNVTRSILDPQRNRGTITKMYRNDSGITTAQLAGLYTLSASTYPGTSIALDSTYIRQLSDKLALVVARYGSSSGTSFKTVMTRTPGGYHQADFYSVKEEYTKDASNYIGDLDKGRLRPEKVISFPVTTISWSSTVFSDTRPSDNSGLVGLLNSNQYSIDGYSHASRTLKFGGTRIRHDKWGGYDRWTLNHTAYHEPRGKWRNGGVVRGDQRGDGTRTWEFELANNGDGIDIYDATNWPNLP